jgi:ABC-type iron transport system FetAB ATPase subunit
MERMADRGLRITDRRLLTSGLQRAIIAPTRFPGRTSGKYRSMTLVQTHPGISPHLAAVPALDVRALESAWAGPFSFSVARGECLAVQGPSGSGKSQLLRIIADLDVNSGSVSLYGQDREKISAPQWRRQVVYQAAEPAWWETTAAGHFTAVQLERVVALLPRVGLREAHLTTDVTRLSTGERQRMALIRSLSVNPRVLLLDEPTAALDAPAILTVEVLLREQLEAGLTIVLVTHSAAQADRLGNQKLTVAANLRQAR